MFKRDDARTRGSLLTRRDVMTGGLAIAGMGAVAAAPGRGKARTFQATAVPTPDPAAIVALAREAMSAYDLRAVILRVVIDGEEVVTEALGESMTGVPATTDMHFRNGAVAISYLSTLMLLFVDDGVITLDDPLSNWLPELPDSDQVTLKMLANMTAGYPDYVQNATLLDQLNEDPFKQYTAEELIQIGLSTPRVFEPGTNWDYSHTNYVILGRALERMGRQPMESLMQERILDPLGLKNTSTSSTPAIPEPVLHAFSSERRGALGIDPGVRFIEESTFWNPSWTLAEGAIQTTNIYDMAATAIAIGTGELLTPESHEAQVSDELLGFGSVLEGCPNCHTLDEKYTYGLGIVLHDSWLLQNPLFFGYGATEAYLPERRIAVAVATTFGERSFDDQGNYQYGNASQRIFEEIKAYLVPDVATPVPSNG
jgi:CubicO group peptidase (beta-lactamase class C family)